MTLHHIFGTVKAFLINVFVAPDILMEPWVGISLLVIVVFFIHLKMYKKQFSVVFVALLFVWSITKCAVEHGYIIS